MRYLSTLLLSLLSCFYANAQTSEDVAVQLSATVQASPAKITLRWKPITFYAPTYYVYKKAKTATSWGTSIATVAVTDSVYVDNSVIVDSGYEYQVLANVGASTKASGYIYAGIKAPAIHNRGTLILIVDTTFTDSCKMEITTLMKDLSGDGWQLVRHDFGRSVVDTTIKAAILKDNATQPNVKAVLLLGHVAVPYSGDLNPDGHPDHKGAWPADVYYSVPTGWSDGIISDSVVGGSLATWNGINDGKWDQSLTPSTALLQVSRIDFYNMPAFAATEFQLMRSYLNRDHQYKMDSLAVRHRGVIHDDIGFFSGEAFGANGWRNFAPLVNKDSITVVGPSMFIDALNDSFFQFACGIGFGSYTTASGIGSTTDFTTKAVNGIFTMAFGSYYGDWNVQNNYLRAPLCSSTPALTSCWTGRPNWFIHHMALGDNIGYSLLLSQNNTTLYGPTGFYATSVHISLMGDLSLRTDYIKRPSNLVITTGYRKGATLTWTASPDAGVIGYNVYRADSLYGYYQKLNSTMLTTTTFGDGGIAGPTAYKLKYYMVRPVKLQSTPSGNYYNMGIGLADTASVSYNIGGVNDIKNTIGVNVFPNPANSYLNVTLTTNTSGIITMYIMNVSGQVQHMVTKQLSAGDNNYSLSVAAMPAGVYSLMVNDGSATVVKKWVKL